MQIVFTPTMGGVRSGTVTITDNSTNSPQIVQLSGVGVDFALAASGSTSQTVNAGSQAVYGLLLTSASGVPGAAAFTCSGAPANTTCVVNPASAVLGGTTVVTVTIATNSAWLRLPSGLGRLQPGVWFAVLLPGLLGFRSRRMRSLLCIVMCFGLIAIAGCGASRVIPETTSTGASGGAPTASGTYNLTVTGTSAGLTRSVGLTLVVK
jgi:hypothetical protein